jgi:hypothetical protein
MQQGGVEAGDSRLLAAVLGTGTAEDAADFADYKRELGTYQVCAGIQGRLHQGVSETESDILSPSEALRSRLDYFSHMRNSRALMEKLAATRKPRSRPRRGLKNNQNRV